MDSRFFIFSVTIWLCFHFYMEISTVGMIFFFFTANCFFLVNLVFWGFSIRFYKLTFLQVKVYLKTAS